jgi:hypothetical protein
MSLDLVAPLDGLRVSLNLVRGDARVATYECSFLWTTKHDDKVEAQIATASAEVRVDPPSVEFRDLKDAPEDALGFARGVLRNIARSIDETTKWPRRITRWRDK